MTSPAASPSPSPSLAAHDDNAADQPKEHDEETPSEEASETGESPEPQSSAAESLTPKAQTASDPPSAAGIAAPSSSVVGVATASAGDWQAVWSPQHNAYYFHNSKTQETTWKNPLDPEASSSAAASTSPGPEAYASTPAAITSLYALQAAAAAQGIDPSLAYLDPSLAASTSSNPAAFTYTAKFNSRTGAFARPDGRDPNHVSEYERAKRMSEAYFDVGQWEKDIEARTAQEESEGKKRKRPTKKDLERFKEQKKQKKIAKTAWLRT